MTLDDKQLLAFTNENFYAIVWGARLHLLRQRIDKNLDVFAALDAFIAADSAMRIGTVKLETPNGPNGQPELFYTGEARLEPLPTEEAKKGFTQAISAQQLRVQIILNHLDADTDAIVELGAGYGLGLFRLAQVLRNPEFANSPLRNVKFHMAEYTSSGRDMCREFLSRANAPDMAVHPIDHKAPDLSFLDGARKVLIHTVHSIEQVGTLPDDYFRTLANAAPEVTGLHLEPFGFQVDTESEEAKAHAADMRALGWNLNFYEVLKGAEAAGDIAIDKVELNAFDIQNGNPGSLAVWHAPA